MMSRTLSPDKSPAPLSSRILAAGLAAFLATAAALRAQSPGAWPQWGRTAQHGGASAAVAQPLEIILADVVNDPFVDAMKADGGGDLFAHYAVPLVDETGVYMTFKSGTYTGFGNWDSITWNVRKLEWVGQRLEVAWTYASDWKPPSLDVAGWEPVFLPAMTADDLFVPGLGGTVHRVSKQSGAEVERRNPFGDLAAARYVAGGLAVDADGSVVYDAVEFTSDVPPALAGAWLVRAAAGGVVSRADFGTLVPGAPRPNDACEVGFTPDQRPWPPSTDATPPTVACGAQRPGLNVVPAIGADGTIYMLSRAHVADRYSYLVAVHPNLTPAWSASLRDILNDGCGVLLVNDNSNLGCRTGSNAGVDPATNRRPAGRVVDNATSSPVVLPDGAVVVGAFTNYNFFRGHLFKFGADGQALATYDFGWDITPAVRAHDGTYSLLLKDNHYTSPDGSESYFVTSLDANLEPEWSFRATNPQNCERVNPRETVCVDDHPDGFEWCVNQPAVDAAGTLFLNSEDGTLYAFDASGAVVGQIFLDTALGAAYTPIALGPDGVVYTQNNGRLFAVGRAEVAARTGPKASASAPASPRVVERP
jgi:outer membrane protein assembly factor BamB